MKHEDTTGPLIADQILIYLSEHPQAQDTVEGIGWWVLEQRVQSFVPRLKEALGELVTEGLVLTHGGPDGRSYYRLNRRRQQEIRTRLAQS